MFNTAEASRTPLLRKLFRVSGYYIEHKVHSNTKFKAYASIS